MHRKSLGAALLAAVVMGCGGGTAQGLDRPPAGLDPGSPRLAADGIAFDRAGLETKAGSPFVIIFENRDTMTHNVSIYADADLRDRRFDGLLFAGPATRWYPVPALAAGTYVFVCDLHPSMRGQLVATQVPGSAPSTNARTRSITRSGRSRWMKWPAPGTISSVPFG